jgi:hypothetical protein
VAVSVMNTVESVMYSVSPASYTMLSVSCTVVPASYTVVPVSYTTVPVSYALVPAFRPFPERSNVFHPGVRSDAGPPAPFASPSTARPE